jgi:peptidoglycan/xylan/chitin deacetylase (PgdA/CDA1 family)
MRGLVMWSMRSETQPSGIRHLLSMPRILVIPLMTLMLVLLAGCGGGSGEESGSGDAGSGSSSSTEQEQNGGAQGTGQESGGGGTTSPADTAGTSSTTKQSRQSKSPAEVGADETGNIMVLEYHRVGGDPTFAPEWTISTEQFRRELTYLYENDYYPVNFRDLVEGTLEVPAGKTPVVLTFDDSSDTQFTMVREGGDWVPDPAGAVGVLADFHREHQDWPMRGTFFVLPEANAPNNLFGQPDLAEKKLRYLADAGFEIGTHTLYHANLAQATPAGVREQLALSVVEIKKRLPDYEVDSLSLPFGEYPLNEALLRSGTWQGSGYDLKGAAEVAGGPSPAPYSSRLDPYHVPRIQTGELAGQSQPLFQYFEQNPDERYVSDGNPNVVSFPEGSGESLDTAEIQSAGKRIRPY